MHIREIQDFIPKAQYKIGQLGEELVDSDGDKKCLDLLLRLSDFLETLANPYLNVPQDELLKIVHHLSDQAGFDELPILAIPGFDTTVITYVFGSDGHLEKEDDSQGSIWLVGGGGADPSVFHPSVRFI